MSHQDIDCNYVFLCRGAKPFSFVDTMSEADLKQSLQGFKSEIVHLVFTEILSEDGTELSDHSKL
jgi:hypothetical protein